MQTKVMRTNMLQRLSCIILLCLCGSMAIYANTYDFSEVNTDGVTLYYKYVESNQYCEVVSGPTYYTEDITTINIPNTVKENTVAVVGIGVEAFYGRPVKHVTLPQNMLYMDCKAFCYCNYLENIDGGNNLVAIGADCFLSCINLEPITIPQSLEYVGPEAFLGCSKFNEPLYNDRFFFYYPTWPDDESEKVYHIPDGIEVINDYAFFCNCTLSEVVIPNSVWQISDGAFSDSHIECCTIPSSVTYIGDAAFLGTWLTEITIPKTVTHFGYNMFVGDFSLESVVFENEMDSIPFGTFQNTFSLKRVKWPASVHKIGRYAFSNSNINELPDLTGIDEIGDFAFTRCEQLKRAVLPSTITEIQNGVFHMCTNIEQVVLPQTITRIGRYAFSQTDKLTSIDIPLSVAGIGGRAFYLAKGLTDLTVHWMYPLWLDESEVFEYVNEVTLHVPEGTKELYAGASQWKDLTAIVDDATGIANATINDNANSNDNVYTLDGKRANKALQKCIYIQNGKKYIGK